MFSSISLQELARLLLPKEIQENFELLQIEQTAEKIRLRLAEKNIPPPLPVELRRHKIISKGFAPEIEVQDFPIRERSCTLHLRRRKWSLEGMSGVVTRELTCLTPDGLKLTTDFAVFLKEAGRIGTGGVGTHRSLVSGPKTFPLLS